MRGSRPIAPGRSASRDPDRRRVVGLGGVSGVDVESRLARSVIRRGLPRMRGCYDSALAGAPGLAGEVTLQLSIGAAGAVTRARLAASTLGHAPMEGCLAGAVRTLRFPAPDGGHGEVTASLTFSIE